MSDIAIHVDNLSKHFRIGARLGRRRRFRDTLSDTFVSPFRRVGKLVSGQSYGAADLDETIWALKDVSFTVNHGEVVGVIGYNGAGKSTLLKVLSQITEPSTGRAVIYGRVGSLLEVGTGFHPELTGRENVYLYGAILGMKRSEILRKFDEIVAFAEVEKFIDTPVKHYSSGMSVRLAFAVAAHVDPEILIVDEVLAVGDVRFQKKCLAKMRDSGQHGGAVLFVSHNMATVTRLCSRAILLEEGRVTADGPAHTVVSGYLTGGLGHTASREWTDAGEAPGDDVVRLRAVTARTDDGQVADTLDIRLPVNIEMEYDVLEGGQVLLPYFHFVNEEGVLAFEASDHDPEWRRRPRPAGRWVSTARIPGNFLSEGTLIVSAAIYTLEPFAPRFDVSEAVGFHVVDTADGDSARGDWPGSITSVVRPLLKWNTHFSPRGAKSPVTAGVDREA